MQAVFGADAAQERQRLAIASRQHVMAIVDPLSGDRIAERGRAPAEPRAGLEYRTEAPASTSAVAADRPANPPPITTTSTFIRGPRKSSA